MIQTTFFRGRSAIGAFFLEKKRDLLCAGLFEGGGGGQKLVAKEEERICVKPSESEWQYFSTCVVGLKRHKPRIEMDQKM